MKKILVIALALLGGQLINAQINAKLMRYMDISDSQICFVYGGDIWIMPKEGGQATALTSSPGEESWPKFSPDGKSIAYTASYGGNADIYVLPVVGGLPTRLTFHSGNDRMVDWHPDGERILFASARENGQRRLGQFYLISREGGMPEKLPLPYGELATFSPDGQYLAYITKVTENYPFKRYRGGLSSDILLYDFQEGEVRRLTDSPAIDGKPAFAGKELFYLSDQGPRMRLNIWAFDQEKEKSTQLTFMEDFDVSYLSGSASELVFEAGGKLYRMDAASRDYAEVPVKVISDLSLELPKRTDVSGMIRNAAASPEGKRLVFEARGELFNAPVKEGYTLNLTRSSGAFDMFPAWSPDGQWVAFWSDRSGEYELYLQDPELKKEAVQLTERGKGFGYQPYWSPDSKSLAFVDETNTIYVVDVESKKAKAIDNYHWNIGHGSRYSFPLSWSPDSRWLAYSKGLDNTHDAIILCELETDEKHQVSSGFYNDSYPVFSEDGKYLYFLSRRNMSAAYSQMGDGTWIYPNATQLAAVALNPEVPSLFPAKNDAMKAGENGDEKDDEKDDEEAEDEDKKEQKEGNITIDPEGMEARVEVLPVKAGNLRWLASFKGKVVYLRYPNTGSGSRSAQLQYFDLEKQEEKGIMADVQMAKLSADSEMILVKSKGNYGLIKAAEKQKIEKPVPTSQLSMDLVEKEEWHQIFQDTWRRYRDFFYDPEMHGVDWNELRVRYGSLVDDARSRWDLNNISSNLLAELSAGHTYTRGRTVETIKRHNTGLLGIDWEQDEKGYRIKHIIRPATWDTEVRSPFDRSGMEVKAGDYIHAVNGFDLDPGQSPYAAFDGLSGKTVALSISSSGSREDAKQVVVKCLSPGEEGTLRYLAWIEHNRLMVDELSDGKLGYVYMSNTSTRGQLELVRMYYGQLEKEGFIIDERFNGGGQLADRFLELLQRPVVYNLHWRHGRDHTHPTKTNTGPMGMLINGWAGSGGDGLPWAFQELEAGPIVGERTLGILVGPATGHMLIDGGGITVPGARLYDNDGHWFWEGEGVAPDIKVWDDPNLLMQGRDPQVERVVKEVLELLEKEPPVFTPAPPRENRRAEDLQGG